MSKVTYGIHYQGGFWRVNNGDGMTVAMGLQTEHHARLCAAVLNTAEALPPDMDPVKAVEALPDMIEALKPFQYTHDPECFDDCFDDGGSADPLEGLPDSHGFQIIWSDDEQMVGQDGRTQFVARHIRSVRSILTRIKKGTDNG